MPTLHPQSIKDFPSLLEYLHEGLDWDVDPGSYEDFQFTYTPEELGLAREHAVAVEEAFQIRTFDETLPVFWFKFKNKRLPIVVLRRILRAFVARKRPGANSASRKTYERPDDLFFICALGQENNRGLTLAHFRPLENEHLAQLRTFGWDGQETHFHYLEKHLEKLKWDNRDNWSEAFIAEHGRAIKDSRELAIALAEFAREIRAYTLSLYEVEVESGPLHQLHKNFGALLGTTSPQEFADAVAQTVTSALLAVRFEGHTLENVALTEIGNQIPFTNPFLTEFIEHLARIGFSSEQGVDFDDLGIEDLKAFLNAVNMQAITEKFGATARGGAEDPVLYFYEDFLKAYDSEQKVKRGVFYTPKPVVDFIVRGVDHLVRTELGFPLGLADASQDEHGNYNVTMLDPAGGTGTFFVSIIELVHDTMCAEWKKQGKRASEYSGLWDAYVSRDLLPRLFGFELMMAPYTIAHLKIGLKLSEFGYVPKRHERVNFFLTNTLEHSQQLALDLPGFLSKEASEAARVKNQTRVTVMVGNPPYSNSMTENSWIMGLIAEFKKNLGEQKADLNREEWKFMRLATHYSAQSTKFVTGWIINNAFLKALTHRLLREHLLSHGEDFYILNLHGSSKPPEHVPAVVQAALGITKKDVNVFDIQQGVTVFASVKKSNSDNVSVRYGDLWGERERKYSLLSKESFDSLITEVLSPKAPQFFLVPKESDNDEEYASGWSIVDAFGDNISGIQSGRDHFVSTLTKSEIKQRIKSVVQKESWEQIAPGVERPSWTGFSLDEYREVVKGNKPHLSQWLSTPFDVRPLLFHTSVIKRTRGALMGQMLSPNFGLCSVRQLSTPFWRHVFVSANLISDTAISQNSREYNYLFPLYVYNPPINWDTQLLGTGKGGRRANLAPAFVARLGTSLKLKWISDGRGDGRSTFGPEDVLAYIYAILHAPSYRSRYAEFLKIDFPRVPLTDDAALFWKLVGRGRELIGLHLLDGISGGAGSTPRGEVAAGYPKYENGKVVINKAGDGFDGVSEEVWNFHIGGYQVAHKWLKDRKGRVLSDEDAAHYRRVLHALEQTIAAMESIDDLIAAHGGWPLPGSQDQSTLSDEEVKSFFGAGDATAKSPRPVTAKPTRTIPTRAKPTPTSKSAPQSTLSGGDERATDDWLVLIRQAFHDADNFALPELVRAVAQRGGIKRLSAATEKNITSAIRTATRRKILNSAANRYYLPRRTISDYDRDALVTALVAVVGRSWMERTDAIRQATAYLGFARVGSNIRNAFKSAINGAIRRKLIESDGDWIRRL